MSFRNLVPLDFLDIKRYYVNLTGGVILEHSSQNREYKQSHSYQSKLILTNPAYTDNNDNNGYYFSLNHHILDTYTEGNSMESSRNERLYDRNRSFFDEPKLWSTGYIIIDLHDLSKNHRQ